MDDMKRVACTTVLWLASAAGCIGCSSDGGNSSASGQGGTTGLSSSGGQTSSGGQVSSGGRTSNTGQSSTGGANSTSTVAAAVSLNLLAGGTNCPLTAGYDDLPSVSGGHPVTTSGATAKVSDASTSARGVVSVACALSASSFGGTIDINGGAMALALHVTRGSNPTGNLQYVPQGATVSYHGTTAAPCTVSEVKVTTTSGLFSVKCPTFTGDDGSKCVLGDSILYFEGCEAN